MASPSGIGLGQTSRDASKSIINQGKAEIAIRLARPSCRLAKSCDEAEDVGLVEHPTPGVAGGTSSIQQMWPRISDSALHQQENQPATLSVRRRQQSPGKTRDSSSTRSSPIRRVLE
ncbi:hypothetical protein AFCA_005487 [Aspergillus flavus]|nr:hypothetical protein AFCA_005487 [Aspergillus flavus]